MFNCMLVDLKGMLSRGFKMGNAEIEPPKSIGTATAVTAQIIAQVASHIMAVQPLIPLMKCLRPMFNSVSEKHLKNAAQWQIPDAEGCAKALIEKECFDAFQSLEYEVNTLHTSNGQTPFVTLGFGLGTQLARTFNSAINLETVFVAWVKIIKHQSSPKLVFTIKKA